LQIILNGQTFEARKPKVKIYKKLMQLQSKMPDNDAWSTPEGLDAAIEILVDAMGDPLITAERIENEMDADALMPALEAVVQWITGTFESADLGEPGRR
jgi:hypothetical protein